MAVYYDSGFGVESARKNIDTACKILEIPLIVIKINIKNHKKMLKESLLMSDILGNFFNTCGNCDTGIKMAAWNVAKQYSIPFILLGDTKFEKNETLKGLTSYEAIIKGFKQKGMIKMGNFSFHFLKWWYFSILQRNESGTPLKSRLRIAQVAEPDKGDVKFLHFFDFLEWEALNKIDFLKETIGWESPIDKPHRYDCMLHCFVNYRWMKDTGISLDGVNFSTMIRHNLLNSVDAIRMERSLEEHLTNETIKTLETLELSQCCKSMFDQT